MAMGGQIVDATLVAAAKQRNAAPEKYAIKPGKTAREIWPDEPAKAAQKDTDVRCTVKFAKAKPLANEAWLKRHSRVSRIHRKKPRGKPMPERTAKANAAKSKVRARVEHVFVQQKDQMGLFVRTIGIKRAEAKITLANLAYNMHRLIFHEQRAATG